MPATAELISNEGKNRPQLTRTVDGYRGEKWYLIRGAASIAECHTASGLPAMGSRYVATAGPGYNARATAFEAVYDGGLNAYSVRVSYEENRRIFTPEAGLVMTTTIDPQSTSETVRYDITGTKRLGEDGTQKLLTAFSIEVLQVFANAAALIAALPGAVNLSNEPKLNDSAIACPNLFDSGTALVIPARQALYYNFKPERMGDFYVLRHMLHWRKSWDYIGQELGDDLEPIASFPPEPVYKDADFAAAFALYTP